MSDLDLQDDDVLRERLGRLASSAARSVPAAPPPEGIRRRGTARRNRRTAAGLVTAGLAVAAVAGVVSETSVLRTAPAQPAHRPSVSVTAAPTPTSSPSASPSPSTSTPTSATSAPAGPGAVSSSGATSGGRPSGGSASAPGTSPATSPAAALPWVADPARAGYEFGFVWGAKRSGDVVLLTFDPAGMLVGAQARAYYDAHPDEERFDYKILNDKSFTQTLRVPASATLYGNQVLGPRNGSQNQRITPDRLVARASGDSHHVAVWLKRSGPSQVVYLAEQYLP
jgi:hypothetical protein